MCKEELPRRPKEIPITEPLPPFPRLGAVVNYRSKVRGKLDYNKVSQVRNIIEDERRKRQEYRTQVRFYPTLSANQFRSQSLKTSRVKS